MSLWWLSPKRVSFVLPQVKERVNPQENAAPAAVCVLLMCQRVSGILNQTLNVSVTQRCLRCFHAGKDGTAPSSVSMSEVCRVYGSNKPLKMWGGL